MKRYIFLLLGLAFLFSCGSKESQDKTNNVEVEKNADSTADEVTYKIGISQTITHNVLDDTKRGFKDAFEEENIKVEWDEKNADGTLSNANTIASTFNSDKKDLTFGIGTLSAQTLSNNITDKPVLFSAVTDPVSAQIIKDNVTGTSDRLENIGEQLDILKSINPGVKKVGILYNSAEQNSLVQVEALKKVAEEKGIEIVELGISSSSEIPSALNILLKNTDALYIPTDNLIVSMMGMVASEAKDAKKIIVASDQGSVIEGALFTQGLDFYELGKRAGKMGIEILRDGKTPKDIPFEMVQNTQLYVNEDTAAALGLDLKSDIFKNAKFVKK